MMLHGLHKVKLKDDEKLIENQIHDLQLVCGEKTEKIENNIDQADKKKPVSSRNLNSKKRE